ncbi:MAG TPA: hypothetical protein VFL89_03330 [Solirubrobacterales bacterium]|nr:hypothetical protein [Solirubrobacterales bacterium]
MNHPRRNRRRAGGLLLAAAALLAAIGALAAVAVAKDGNEDRIPDKWEKHHHLSLHVKQTHRDQDHDHLGNRAEFLAGDNPRDRDSDDDGVIDGNENAGKIASFDAATGKLTIELFGGDSISGVVTESTRIKCEDQHGVARTSREEEPGDDHGGAGAEPGDDHGGNSGPGSSNSGAGSDNSGPGRGGEEDGANCTTADLSEGAVVQEAELEIEHGAATFEEVELAG